MSNCITKLTTPCIKSKNLYSTVKTRHENHKYGSVVNINHNTRGFVMYIYLKYAQPLHSKRNTNYERFTLTKNKPRDSQITYNIFQIQGLFQYYISGNRVTKHWWMQLGPKFFNLLAEKDMCIKNKLTLPAIKKREKQTDVSWRKLFDKKLKGWNKPGVL